MSAPVTAPPQPVIAASTTTAAAAASVSSPAAAPVETKPRDDAAAADAAEQARVAATIEQYVQAMGNKRVDVMRRLYPGMSEGSRRGFEALFAVATDVTTRVIGAPSVTVRGTSADAQFTYEMTGHDPTRGNFTQRPAMRAHLQKTGDGWIIQSIAAQ